MVDITFCADSQTFYTDDSIETGICRIRQTMLVDERFFFISTIYENDDNIFFIE